ncbi:hypothetical protein Bp8pS_196 [Bacillus phage vB_BpuM-BpSp]|nr:hypothetical protein Bp8pS_196 [Bacillus phage vB_BpuM-BpSp]
MASIYNTFLHENKEFDSDKEAYFFLQEGIGQNADKAVLSMIKTVKSLYTTSDKNLISGMPELSKVITRSVIVGSLYVISPLIGLIALYTTLVIRGVNNSNRREKLLRLYSSKLEFVEGKIGSEEDDKKRLNLIKLKNKLKSDIAKIKVVKEDANFLLEDDLDDLSSADGDTDPSTNPSNNGDESDDDQSLDNGEENQEPLDGEVPPMDDGENNKKLFIFNGFRDCYNNISAFINKISNMKEKIVPSDNKKHDDIVYIEDRLFELKEKIEDILKIHIKTKNSDELKEIFDLVNEEIVQLANHFNKISTTNK